MGIDYDNCDVCGEIYADCDDFGSCEGCRKSWCSRCNESYRSFRYGDKIRCDLCFSTDPKPVTKSALFDYALEKLKTTKDELVADLKRTRPEYNEPQNTYSCQDEREHICIESCTALANDFDDDSPEQDYIEHVRGRCCNSCYPDDPSEHCDECKKPKSKKSKSEK